jgi:hypothetical protein
MLGVLRGLWLRAPHRLSSPVYLQARMAWARSLLPCDVLRVCKFGHWLR